MKYLSKHEFKISRYTRILLKYLSNVFAKRTREKERVGAFFLCLGLFYYQVVKSMWHTEAGKKQQHSLAWIFPFFGVLFCENELHPFSFFSSSSSSSWKRCFFFSLFSFLFLVSHNFHLPKKDEKVISNMDGRIFLILLIWFFLCAVALIGDFCAAPFWVTTSNSHNIFTRNEIRLVCTFN